MKIDSEKIKRKLDRLSRIKERYNRKTFFNESNIFSPFFTREEKINSSIQSANFKLDENTNEIKRNELNDSSKQRKDINKFNKFDNEQNTLDKNSNSDLDEYLEIASSNYNQEIEINENKKNEDLVLAEDFSLYKDNIEEPKHLEKNRLKILSGEKNEQFDLNKSEISQRYNSLKLKLRTGKISTKQLYRELINCENCINKVKKAEETYDCLLRVDEYERRFFENVLIKEILSLSDNQDTDLAEKSKRLTEEAYLYEINANSVKQKLINRDDIFDLAKFTGQKFLLRLQQNFTYDSIKNNYFYKEEIKLLDEFVSSIKGASSNQLISEKEACELILDLVKNRNSLADEFLYNDYYDMACNLQESVDLAQNDYEELSENIKKELAECFFLLNKQKKDFSKEENNLINFHRLREKYIRNITNKEISFEVDADEVIDNKLPKISSDQSAILTDVLYLIRKVLFDDEKLGADNSRKMSDVELEKSSNNRQSNSFLKQIQKIKDNYPNSLVENGLIYFIDREKISNYKRDRILYSFQQRKRRFEHLPPSEFRSSSDSIIYLPQSRLAICLLDEVKHSYDIWFLLNSLGRALRMIEASRVDLLLLEEKALRVNDLFAAYSLETLTMQKMDAARQGLELYIDNLLRRARYDDINSYHYKSILARKQLERLSPFRKRLNREIELKDNLIKRRLMAMIEDLLKSSFLHEFQVEIYKKNLISNEELIELWNELHQKYFIDGIRQYKINDASVLKEILYKPFDSKQKMLALYCSLLMWDRAKKNYQQSVDDYKDFIKNSGHQSFYSLFNKIFDDEYLSEDMMKRLVYQLAKFLEAKSLGADKL